MQVSIHTLGGLLFLGSVIGVLFGYVCVAVGLVAGCRWLRRQWKIRRQGVAPEELPPVRWPW